MDIPGWGRAARLIYKVALGAFVGLWIAGIAFGIDPVGDSPAYVAWIVAGAVGLLALMTWLASEFVTGRRERDI